MAPELIILFMAIFLFSFYLFLLTRSIRYTKSVIFCMKQFSKEFNFDFVKENFILKDLISFIKKPSFSAFKCLLSEIFFYGFNSNRVRGSIKYRNIKIPFEIGTKLIKVREFTVPVTYFEFKNLPNGSFFQISNKDIFHNLESIFIKDIEFNLPEFDKKFLVLGKDPDFVKRIVTKQIIDLLLTLKKNIEITFENGTLIFQEERYIQDYQYFKNVMLINLLLLKNIFDGK